MGPGAEAVGAGGGSTTFRKRRHHVSCGVEGPCEEGVPLTAGAGGDREARKPHVGTHGQGSSGLGGRRGSGSCWPVHSCRGSIVTVPRRVAARMWVPEHTGVWGLGQGPVAWVFKRTWSGSAQVCGSNGCYKRSHGQRTTEGATSRSLELPAPCQAALARSRDSPRGCCRAALGRSQAEAWVRGGPGREKGSK